MKNKYQNTAKEIFTKVGGENNIASVTHCVTRLRLVLKDESKVDDDVIKKIPNVMGIMKKSGQYQIILGNDVANYYNEFEKLGSFKEENSKKETSILSSIVEYIAGSMTPLIPALLGGGMLKVLVIILPMLGILSAESQTISFLTFFGDAPYYFMPLLLAYSASQKLKVTPTLAMAVAGIMLHPSFVTLVTEGKEMAFFGVKVIGASYASSVIPILIMVWIMKYIENFMNKIIPAVTKSFLQPTLVLIISGFIALVVVGPLGTIVGQGLSWAAVSLHGFAGWLTLAILGAIMPFIVMTGMHWAFAPIFLAASIATPDVLILPAMLGSNLAQGAAAVAVGLRSKNSNTKQVSFAAGFSALLAGITEPALYGVTLKYKKPLYAAMIGGGVAGLYAGIVSLKSFVFAVPSIIGLPQFINKEIPSNFTNAIITLVISVVITFILAYIFGIDEDVSEDEQISDKVSTSGQAQKIIAPVSGKLVQLENVSDITFSNKVMGEGVAILPEDNKIISPFDGEVVSLFPTKHAIGLKANNGLELLIHIGLETVNLKGEGFTNYVEVGDKIKKGQLLLEVDFSKLKDQGYDIVTPIIVTNTNDYLEIFSETKKEKVTTTDEILFIL